MLDFDIGSKYCSFEDLNLAIKIFNVKHEVNFKPADFQKYKKNSDLVYKRITFECDGMTDDPSKKCPAYITLKLNAAKNGLKVTSFMTDHNHPIKSRKKKKGKKDTSSDSTISSSLEKSMEKADFTTSPIKNTKRVLDAKSLKDSSNTASPSKVAKKIKLSSQPSPSKIFLQDSSDESDPFAEQTIGVKSLKDSSNAASPSKVAKRVKLSSPSKKNPLKNNATASPNKSDSNNTTSKAAKKNLDSDENDPSTVRTTKANSKKDSSKTASSSKAAKKLSSQPSPSKNVPQEKCLFDSSDESNNPTKESPAKSSESLEKTSPIKNVAINKVTKRKDYIDWEHFFMGLALMSTKRSKDPNTQVGACIANQENKVVAIGYNGMPNGCSDDILPWDRTGNFKDSKYAYVCHAEMNAILNKNCYDVRDCTIYVTLFPCNECAKLIIQSRIKEVVYLQDKYKDAPPTEVAKKLFEMVGIKIRQFTPKIEKLEISFIP